MEHVELETLDREHTASNKKDPQLNHEKKPTKKKYKSVKVNWYKNTSVCFYYSIYRWLQRIVWFNRDLHRRLYCNRLINVFKLDIGIKHTQAPFVIFGLFVLTGLSAFVAAINPWLGLLINFITVCAIMVLSGQRAEYRSFYAIFTLLYFHAKHSRIRH